MKHVLAVLFLVFAFVAQATPTTTKHATVLSPVVQSLPSPVVAIPAQPTLNIIPMQPQAGVWIWDKFMQLWNCKIGWNQPLEWCWYPPVNPN